MVFDPKAVAYAFIESYLNNRSKNKWVLDLANISPENLNEKVSDEATREKIKCCLEAIRHMNEVKHKYQQLALTLTFSRLAKEQDAKAPSFLWMSRTQVAATLLRALQALFIADQCETDAYKSKLAELNNNLNQQKQLLTTTSDKDQKSHIQSKIKAYEEMIAAYDPKNNAHIDFYNSWVKSDDYAKELKEDSWEGFLKNVEDKKRKTDFCDKIGARYVKVEKPSTSTFVIQSVLPEPKPAPAPSPTKVLEKAMGLPSEREVKAAKKNPSAAASATRASTYDLRKKKAVMEENYNRSLRKGQ